MTLSYGVDLLGTYPSARRCLYTRKGSTAPFLRLLANNRNGKERAGRMSGVPWIDLLRQSRLLSGVPDAVLQAIDASLAEVTAKRGTTLFDEGDIGDAAYYVMEGMVSIESQGVPLIVRGKGDWVGEFALIDDQPRSASAVAATDVVLLKWQREDFETSFHQSPELNRGIFRTLTEKLREDVSAQRATALEQERWRQDLERARQIQMGMLPQTDVRTADIEISGYCSPASGVGGDYYDYLSPGGGKVGAIICDVTGHGFYSGLFVAMAKSCFHTQAQIDYSPTHVVEAMKRVLALSITRRLLMTCFYVLFDPGRGLLAYSNAGHPSPYHLIKSTNALEQLFPIDTILGVDEPGTTETTQAERAWNSGDLLVMYTDGIPEARDPRGQMFGNSRLEECIIKNSERTAPQIREDIMVAIDAHCGGAPPNDDVALVVARAL